MGGHPVGGVVFEGIRYSERCGTRLPVLAYGRPLQWWFGVMKPRADLERDMIKAGAYR
jgi:hypothetical protein